MRQEKLFASFVLDRESDVEIALQAKLVVEATSSDGAIKPLPTSIDFLEGLFHLRDTVIPVINLKKKLGLDHTDYTDDAKVAVIQTGTKRFGLLFDDIRDVLRVDSQAVTPLDPALMGEDSLIHDLIILDGGFRTVKVLDLDGLFPGEGSSDAKVFEVDPVVSDTNRAYSRFVIFSCNDQPCGIPVEDAREICFLSDIDEMFKSGLIEGALQLRGNTIPVLHSGQLLSACELEYKATEDTRVLVMESGDLSFGLIVDKIHEILIFPDDEILSVPGNKVPHVRGICQCGGKQNVMLLNVLELINSQLEAIKEMARKPKKEQQDLDTQTREARHLITENCYLIFSIEKHFAIELKDIQEILESDEIMEVARGVDQLDGLINLRGEIVPVLDLGRFYQCNEASPNIEAKQKKLIIGKANGNLLALMVDEIVTIYKQETFHKTPSLRPELQGKKDTLDRLIEFRNEDGVNEHVLVVNVENILRKHLQIQPPIKPQEADMAVEINE